MRRLFLCLLASLAFAAVRAESAKCDGLLFKDGDSIAFLGDSITQAGANANGYITLFEKTITNLGIEHYTMYKKGRGGDTSKQMLERVDADVIAWKPTWTTFSCGVNDICYAARRQTLEQYQANVTAIFDKFDAIKTKVVVLTTTLLYENAANATLDSYVDWLRAEAKRRGYVIAEVNEAMKAAAKALGSTGRAPWKLTVDGIHMNDVGNRVMAWELLKAFGVPEGRKDEIFKIFTSGKLIPATPKAVWREGTKSLTFYFDTRSYDQAEGVTKVFAINAQGDRSWEEVLPSVEQVTFDLSFVYFQPSNCNAWFWNASKLKEVNRLDYLNTGNCRNMAQMFGGCTSLTTLDFSFTDTSKVENMSQMLRFMKIKELDLSHFDTSNVQSFWQMFLGDEELERIRVSDKFVTTKTTDTSDMFGGCKKLVGANGTAFDQSKRDGAMARIDAPGNPGYFSQSAK